MKLRNLCAALSALAASVAHAAPAAPVVTVGANDIKQLQFDWAPVPTANTYELWFRANPGAPWVIYSRTPAQRPYFRVGISVHLLDFAAARYYVKACNPSGCSASAELGVEGLANDATGYIKPRIVGNHFGFGTNVTLSADGATLAVLTGETLGEHVRSAVVHIYRRTSRTSAWRREARLIPSTVQSYTASSGGMPLALSADGSRLAFGVFREDAPGILDPADTGAVYLFRRDGVDWTLEQKIAPPTPHQSDYFGSSIDMDDAGTTLVVSRQDATSPPSFNYMQVYRRGAEDNVWSLSDTLLPPPVGAGLTASCDAFTLSGNGKRLFRSCGVTGPANRKLQVLEAPVGTGGWRESAVLGDSSTGAADSNYDGTSFIGGGGTGIEIWVLTSSGWTIDSGPGLATGLCAPWNCAISRDGKLAVIQFSTAALVFERKTAGWRPRKAVRAWSANIQSFGQSLAFGDNGRTLAVGAPLDPSAAAGIDGDRDDQTAPQRGAVWLY